MLFDKFRMRLLMLSVCWKKREEKEKKERRKKSSILQAGVTWNKYVRDTIITPMCACVVHCSNYPDCFGFACNFPWNAPRNAPAKGKTIISLPSLSSAKKGAYIALARERAGFHMHSGQESTAAQSANVMLLHVEWSSSVLVAHFIPCASVLTLRLVKVCHVAYVSYVRWHSLRTISQTEQLIIVYAYLGLSSASHA